MSAPRLRLTFRPAAEDDLESIGRYGIETWGEAQADRYLEEIADVLDSLARFPRLGMLHGDLAGETRSIRVGQHRIIYRVEPNQLDVVRIVHTRVSGIELDDLSEQQWGGG